MDRNDTLGTNGMDQPSNTNQLRVVTANHLQQLPDTTETSTWIKRFPTAYSCWLGSDANLVAEKATMDVEGKVGCNRPKKKHGGWKTMAFIFGNEFGEKLAAVGFGANMISYLTLQMHMDNVKAATTLTNFAGTASLTPLFGAYLADAYVGRFWTITGATIFYIMGMAILTVSAIKRSLRPPSCSSALGSAAQCIPASAAQMAILYMALLLKTLGSGGIRPCVAAFGADQFDQQDPKEGKKLWSFFNWYYFCMGAAGFIGVTVVVYIQDNVGWGLGFGIPALVLLVALLGFVVGLPLYVHVPPMGSPLARLFRVIVAAYKKWRLPLPLDPSSLYELHGKEAASEPSPRLLHSDQFKFLDKAAIKVERDIDSATGKINPKRLCTVTEVEELKAILRMGPIWASGILLITASAQQNTFSVLQARSMDRHLGSSFRIPPASMTIFSFSGLLITVPLYDRIFMPLARRVTGHPRGITFLQRMGIGFFISTIATLIAGFVEVKRRHAAAAHGLLDHPKHMIPISVFWLLPQYALHGIAEAFMSIGHLEFFYDQSPESMRSTATALFWTSISAGNYLSTFLVSIIHKTTGGSGHGAWLPNNLNKGHLEYFFWLLTVLQFLNLIFFIFCARFYKYKPVATKESALKKTPDTN